MLLRILLLLLLATRTFAQGELAYKLTASDNHMWQLPNTIYIERAGGPDSLRLTNFTNHGATVWATAVKGGLFVPRQTVTIIPNGPGPTATNMRIQWDITVEGQGILNDSVLELRFYFKNATYETTGNIKAIRWTTQMEATHQRQLGLSIDTTIGGVVYHVQMHDTTGRLIAIGEYNTDKIKYGRWLLLNPDGSIARQVKYERDTLNGQATEYTGSDTREQGLYVNGKRTGQWLLQKKQKRKWQTLAHVIYDADGNKISQATYYDYGGVWEELYYDRYGSVIWQAIRGKDGNVRKEGKGITLEEINLDK